MKKYSLILLVLLFCLAIANNSILAKQTSIVSLQEVDYEDWDMCSESGLKNLFAVMQNNPRYSVKLNEVICGASSIKRYLTRKGIDSRRIRISGISSCSCYGTATDGSTQCALSDFVVYDGNKNPIDLYTLEQQL